MIYFLRHGEDDENYVGGWSDVDLTQNGIMQVKNTCSIIRRLPITSIVSSDVKRARTTASIVGERLNLQVQYSDKFRELDKGLLTGLSREKAKEMFPMYVGNIEIDKKYPNGESMLDLYRRIKELLKEIENWNNVLVVTHRGVINMIYFLMENRLPDNNKEQFNVTHASIHEWDQEKKKIRRIEK